MAQPSLAGCFVGLCTVDLTYMVGKFPGADQKVAATQNFLTAGGPAANAAVTFSALGGRASLMSALGTHALARIASEDLIEHGVALQDLSANPLQPPTVSSICVLAETGARTIVSANVAAHCAAPDKFRAESLGGVNILLVDGHHLDVCIAAALGARSRRIPVVMDGGSWKEGMSGLLPFVDVAICSADFKPPGADTIALLRRYGVRHIAITRGADPVLWISPHESGTLPVLSIEPKDTTGAGDIFHGAFCWAYASGSTFPRALEFAARIATESCRYYGTRAWTNSIDKPKQ